MSALLALIGIKNAKSLILPLAVGVTFCAALLGAWLYVSHLQSENDALRSDLALEQFKNAQQARTIESVRSQHAVMLKNFQTLSARNSVDFQKWQSVSDELDITPTESHVDAEAARINRLNRDLNRMLSEASRFTDPDH